MSMTLGRCTLTEDPYNQRWDGDRWSFTIDVVGVAQAGTVVDDYKAKVQQLRGLMDNEDEDVFPVTWSEDSTLDGFYDEFRVSITPFSVYLATGAGTATVSCRRVAGAAAALFENTITVVAQTNGYSLPAAAWASKTIAVPYTDLLDASSIVYPVTGNALLGAFYQTGVSRTVDGGIVRRTESTVENFAATYRWTWATTPALFYEASARVEQSFGGTYYPLQGQQNLKSSNAWRVSNGLVRVSLSATTIDVAHYDGSAWDTTKSWVLGQTSSSTVMSSVKAVRVIKNTPHTCIVRATVAAAGAGISVCNLDITLRRGNRYASFVLSSPNSLVWYIDNNEAGTAITAGIRATSTDAAGNRYVVASPSAQTNVVATGRLKLTSAAYQFPFMIGSDVGAAGVHADEVEEYILATTEDQRVIAR